MDSICQIRLPPHIFSVLRENRDLIDDHFMMSETMAKIGSGPPTTAHGLSSLNAGLSLHVPLIDPTNSQALGSAGRFKGSSMGSQGEGKSPSADRTPQQIGSNVYNDG